LVGYYYTRTITGSVSMFHLLRSQWNAPFPIILLVSIHPFPTIIHSALRDFRDGMITCYEVLASSDTYIDLFGVSRIIWSTPWDTHSALHHS